jgi:hypothetical protein
MKPQSDPLLSLLASLAPVNVLGLSARPSFDVGEVWIRKGGHTPLRSKGPRTASGKIPRAEGNIYDRASI